MATQNIRRLLKALWIKSCRYDSIDPNSKFIVFSNDNPVQKRYARIMRLYIAGRNKGFTGYHARQMTTD